MKTALTLDGPSAIRYPRGVVAGVCAQNRARARLPVGKAEILSDGADASPSSATQDRWSRSPPN